jgi:phosphatidylserine/phosphatidylglycerophosphate/cardiolipin synthase-like enzyme
VVKLHLRHSLHAKLYLLFRHDPVSPTIGFLGSSNLTFAGLSKQGELNVDVTDHDACKKLAMWLASLPGLRELIKLVTQKHKKDKVLVFTQLGDTVAYLAAQLHAAGISGVGAATGDSEDVTFIPVPGQRNFENAHASLPPDSKYFRIRRLFQLAAFLYICPVTT